MNVDEWKRARDALLAAEKRFRTLAEQLPLVTFTAGLEGFELDYVSPQVEELTGYTSEQWKSDPRLYERALHPEDRDRVLAAAERSMATREPFAEEYRLVRPDGSVVWVREEVVTVRDEKGVPLYAQGYMADITQQKQAEGRLRGAEEQFRTMVEQLPLVTYRKSVTPGAPRLYISPEIVKLTGYPYERWLEEPQFIWEIMHPEDARRVRAEHDPGREFTSQTSEYRIVRADGEVVWVRDVTSRIYDENGTPLYVQGFCVDITGQKLAELELVESERRYRSLVEHLPVATFVAPLDEPGPFLFASPRFADLLGYPIEEWTTNPDLALSIVHPDDRATVERGLREAKAARLPYDAEFRVLTADGRTRWIEVATVAVSDDEANPLYRQGYFRDITERKERERRKALELTIANLLAGTAVVDKALDSTLIAICQAFDWHWGCFWRVDRNGLTMRSIAHWRLPSLEADAFEAATESLPGRRGSGLCGRIWRSGAPIWIEDIPRAGLLRSEAAAAAGLRSAVGCPIKVGDRVVGVLELLSTSAKQQDGAFVETLTLVCKEVGQFLERMDTEKDLREAERGLAEAQRIAQVGSWSWDLLDDSVFWSDELLQIFGLERSGFDGTFEAVARCVHPDDRGRFEEVSQRLRETGEPSSLDHRIIRPDGAIRTIHTEGKVVFEDGRPVRMAGIAQDVTERHELELLLRHAQKMEAVGRLAGGVAHDFNNLLLAIRGYADLARADLVESPESAAGSLDQITRSTESAASLIGQLLALSRRQVLQPRPVDLNEVVSERADLLRRVVGESIVLELDLAAGLRPASLDPGQMEQALFNLVLNARDAMPDGGRLRIATSNVGRSVRVAVADTGHGMDEATAERVFEPFFTTKGGIGTGLGLSTVHGFVEQSGGLIRVDSLPGRGATFELMFPAVEAVQEPDPDLLPRPTAGTETVLLVEDEETIRRMLAEVLTREGYVVLEAANGEEALDVAAAADPPVDVLVTDVVMPRLGGVSTAERLTGSRPELRVIYMSGHVRDIGSLEEIRAKGVFLQKPFAPADLAARIREVLDREPLVSA